MKYKNFLFDWDGSLADTLPIWYEGYKKVFANQGVEITKREFGEEIVGDWEAPEKRGITDPVAFIDEVENEVQTKLDMAKLNPGVMEILKKIKEKGGKIAVVTTSKKRWVKGALRNNGLRDLVDVFLGKEDVEYVKPDPEGLIKALRFMGGKAAEAIVIGDNGKDVMAGRAARMDTGLYFPKRYEEFYLRNRQLGFRATMIIEDFEELEKFLG